MAKNLECADVFLREASQAGAELAVLPEMFNTGYGLLPDYAPHAEGIDGPTLRYLCGRSRQWRTGIIAGFVERGNRQFYDATAVCLPDGSVQDLSQAAPGLLGAVPLPPGRRRSSSRRPGAGSAWPSAPT